MTISEDLVLDTRRAHQALDTLDRQITNMAGAPIALELDTGDTVAELRSIEDRLASLTGEDRQVLIRASADQARAAIRDLERQLGSEALSDQEIRILVDRRNEATQKLAELEAGLDRVEAKAERTSVGVGDVLGAGAFVAGTRRLIDAAADAEQSVGGLEVVFGGAADEVDRFNQRADRLAGLSQTASRQLTAGLGGALKGLGFDIDAAAEKSLLLTQRGADLAATFGGTTQEAVEAVGAALRGEFESLERFNVFLRQSKVDQEAVNLGLATSVNQVSEYARAQATLELILRGSADAAGQFARELDTASGQAAFRAAERANAAADLGETLLPLYVQLNEVAGIAAGAASAIPGPLQLAGIALVGFGAVARPVRAGIEGLSDGFGFLRDRVTAADGGLRGIGTRAAGVALQLGAVYTAVQLLGDQADRADLSELENSLLDVADGGRIAGAAADVFGEDLGKLGRAVERLAAPSNLSRVENVVDGLGRAFGDTDDDLSQARARVDDLDKALASLAARDPAAAAAALERITASLSPEGAERLPGLLDDYAGALSEVDTNARTAAPAVAGVTDELGEQDAQLQTVNESLDLFRQGMEDAFSDLGIEEAIDRRSQALADLATGIADRSVAVEEARRRLADLKALPVDQRPEDFARQVRDAQEDIDEALANTSLTLDGNSDAARRNRDELRNLVDDVGRVIEAHRDEGASLDELRYIRDGEIANLRTQLEQMGFNREEIDRYVGAIEAIPLTAATTVTVDTAAAHLRIKELVDSLEELAGAGFAGTIDAGVIDRNLQRAQIQARRAGGRYGRGWRLVGEEGPELDWMDGGGYVTSATDSRRFLNELRALIPPVASAVPQFAVRSGVAAAAAAPLDYERLAKAIATALPRQEVFAPVIHNPVGVPSETSLAREYRSMKLRYKP